jgi:CheY-like chemotaxis protein
MVRDLACRILGRLGYRTLMAEGADQALEIFRAHKDSIDLLLTDVVMPRVGGPELAERLHELEPRLPVLFMSGYTDDAVGREGVLDPEVPFLQKPFTPEALGQKVREVLGGATPEP